MYNLRFTEIIHNIQCVKNHVSRFVSTANEMYPLDPTWILEVSRYMHKPSFAEADAMNY